MCSAGGGLESPHAPSGSGRSPSAVVNPSLAAGLVAAQGDDGGLPSQPGSRATSAQPTCLPPRTPAPHADSGASACLGAGPPVPRLVQHAGELAGTGSGPDLDAGAVALRPVACRSQRGMGGLSGLLPAEIQVEEHRAEPGLQLGGVPVSATRPAEMITT
jgi:hypothetical protein